MIFEFAVQWHEMCSIYTSTRCFVGKMNGMKKYIRVVVVMLLLVSNFSFAQVARPKHEERSARRAERREWKSNSRLQSSDRKADRHLQKKENKIEKKEDKHKEVRS